MKSVSSLRGLPGRLLPWAALAGLGIFGWLIYRWAEPSPAAFVAAQNAGGGGVTIRLTKTPFAGYIGGAKTWTLWAGSVEMERIPGAGLSNIQSATLTDIRDGILYEPSNAMPSGASPPAASSPPVQVMDATGASSHPSGPISARFHAKQGRYVLGAQEPLPPELAFIYNAQWRFKLTGDVDFQTRAGERLRAPAITIYALTNRRTGKPEQRILCDEGAQLSKQGAQITANQLRYNPADRVVECLGGARGTFKEVTMQSERAFFSLKDDVLRCPDTVTGTFKTETRQDIPFTAEGVTLDLKNRRHHANHIHIQPRIEEGEIPRLP